MKSLFFVFAMLSLAITPSETGAFEGSAPSKPAIAWSTHSKAVARPLKLSRSDMRVDWAVENTPELACGGGKIAGGASSGEGNFTHLGLSGIRVTAAWDIGHLLDPNKTQFVPVGPAGGPVAPVLGSQDYPYVFHFDPFTGRCGTAVVATGDVVLTAANGDKVLAAITGGETYRLDFVNPGDGVETFAIAEIVGGTGRFENATGSFVSHSITRFDYSTGRFVIDLTEVLPGGTIVY